MMLICKDCHGVFVFREVDRLRYFGQVSRTTGRPLRCKSCSLVVFTENWEQRRA
jgi:hypothetical protein